MVGFPCSLFKIFSSLFLKAKIRRSVLGFYSTSMCAFGFIKIRFCKSGTECLNISGWCFSVLSVFYKNLLLPLVG